MAPQRSVRFVLVFAALVLFAPAVWADADWPVQRGPSHEPVPYTYNSKQLEKLPHDFLDDAAACILYAGNTYLVDADGTIETITHDVTRLNGRKGVEKLGEYRNITYDPSYQKLTLHVARVHKSDGRIVDVQPRHVHLRDVSTDYQVYDHEKQFIISFPSLEVGDVIEVKWTIRGKNPEHGGHFFTRYSFGDTTYPVGLDELRVRLPKDRPLKYAAEGGKLETAQSEKDGQVTYHWKQTNVPRPTQDENLPPKEELRVSLACSTFPSWEAVGKWKQKLRSDCWDCSVEVRKIVAEVTKDLTDPIARARALTYWVRRNLRYISSGEKHDYTPNPPDQVLANRYGDCKDTSQFLAVMLAEAGLQVELATLGVQDDGQVLESVPSPWGTHAILLVTINGEQHWIDTTTSLSSWDLLPHDDRDRLCYVVDRKGSIRMVRTPKLTAQENRIEQRTEVWIGPDGSSRNERSVVSYGLAGVSQRDMFLDVPVGERRRQVSSELLDSNSRTRLVKLTVDEKALKDFDGPTRVGMSFEIAGHFTGTPDREGSVADSKVWAKLLAYTLDYDRLAAMQYYAPFISEHRYIVHLPAAYYLETVPKERTLRSPWAEFKLTVKTPEKGDLTHDVELFFQTRMDKTRIEPADFDAFRKFHEEVTKHYRSWVTLKPAQDLEDAPALEAILAWAPADADSAAALARLYQVNNRNEEARRVLKRACFYSPDEPALWELAVKVAATKDEEEAAQKELVKRFPDETKYSIALGAVMVGEGKVKEARALLEPLTKNGAAATRAHAHYQLARSYYREDKLKEALRNLDDAGKADPEAVNTVRAHHLRGQVLEEMGKPKEAVAAYLQALAVEHDADETLEALVRLERAQGRTSEALAYLRRLAAAAGDDSTGLLKAADLYYQLERYDDAFDLASRARDLRFHEQAQRIIGLVYLKRGDAAKALFHLDKAELDAVVAEGLVHAALEVGDLKQVAARSEQAHQVKVPTPELKATLEQARRLLARREELKREAAQPGVKLEVWSAALDAVARAERDYHMGSSEKALAALKPALTAGLDVGPALALRARLTLEHGKLGAALTDAEQAVRLSPKEPGGFYVRGRVKQERGDKGALTDLARAVELSQKQDADMLHYLAAALFQSGKRAEALTAQRLAVQLRPRDQELTAQLQAFEKANGG
jgi:tetratricopeptide (TPR) repeat protein